MSSRARFLVALAQGREYNPRYDVKDRKTGGTSLPPPPPQALSPGSSTASTIPVWWDEAVTEAADLLDQQGQEAAKRTDLHIHQPHQQGEEAAKRKLIFSDRGNIAKNAVQQNTAAVPVPEVTTNSGGDSDTKIYTLNHITGELEPVDSCDVDDFQDDIFLGNADIESPLPLVTEEDINADTDVGVGILAPDDTPRTRKRKDNPRESVRKRAQNPSYWISNQRKVAKNTGKSFTNSKGKVVPPSKIRNPCSCRMKCSLKFPPERRLNIFEDFWKIGDHTRQWDYVTRHSRSTPTKKKTVGDDSRRKTSRSYFFNNEAGDEVPVCKYMFLATLGIWDGWIASAYKHITSGRTKSMSPDKRGKHCTRLNKITEEKTNSVITHINKYPRIPSHYTRARSKREYVASGLSVEKMSRHYAEWCTAEKVPEKSRASARQYRAIFNTKFNIGFFIPKKDQCSVCKTIKSCTREERDTLKAKWMKHLKYKSDSRKERQRSKDAATADHSIYYCCFDLQNVMQCPKSDASDFYYESKLSIYNFTVFNAVEGVGTCYVWHEVTARRGANDIASSLLHFIQTSVGEGMKELRSFSDSCSGQNRNRYMFAMLLLAAVRFKIKISHQFMEPGHTQNENDSIHACIERASQGKDIYDFDGWVNLIKTAKVQHPPYRVVTMEQKDIYDFKAPVSQQNWKNAVDGHAIKWSQVRSCGVHWE